IQTVAQLPGFTRGLDFVGPFAFVGISQIRETAIFSGIPLTQQTNERNCGVWAVDLRNGEVVAFLRFEEAVQEIFAVSVLQGIRFPEVINHDKELLGLSYSLPDEALKEAFVPEIKDHAQLHQNKGLQLYQEGKLDEAAKEFEKAVKMQPDFLPARANLGITLVDLEQYDQAIEQLQQVVRDDALNADAYRSMGFAYSQKREIDSAIQYLRKAIEVRVDFAAAHLNLAMLLLLKCEYLEGWQEYEWRWKTSEFTPFDPGRHPRWDGKPLPDRTLLIHTEQGDGDVIQFLRFIPEVASRCNKLLFVAPVQLHPLLEGLADNLVYREAGTLDVKDFDAYLPIMSLPLVLEVFDDSAIPAATPYIKAGSNRVPLITDKEKSKVGVVWGGSPTFGNDKHRSMPFEALIPLLKLKQVQWFSLQKGDASKALEGLNSALQIQDLGSRLNDYGDTASVIRQLDLVISVDTSVCHLAGALGCETWILLAYDGDWRWQFDRLDSPWYPTTRLFRQKKQGDWKNIICVVKESLIHFSRLP
ncbi:MAG: DUF4915 domain-containing protein, partial [bacterium]|nr:DUF4915 domain-containing protein [bacterium]